MPKADARHEWGTGCSWWRWFSEEGLGPSAGRGSWRHVRASRWQCTRVGGGVLHGLAMCNHPLGRSWGSVSSQHPLTSRPCWGPQGWGGASPGRCQLRDQGSMVRDRDTGHKLKLVITRQEHLVGPPSVVHVRGWLWCWCAGPCNTCTPCGNAQHDRDTQRYSYPRHIVWLPAYPLALGVTTSGVPCAGAAHGSSRAALPQQHPSSPGPRAAPHTVPVVGRELCVPHATQQVTGVRLPAECAGTFRDQLLGRYVAGSRSPPAMCNRCRDLELAFKVRTSSVAVVCAAVTIKQVSLAGMAQHTVGSFQCLSCGLCWHARGPARLDPQPLVQMAAML
jgi:hypothetical protein